MIVLGVSVSLRPRLETFWKSRLRRRIDSAPSESRRGADESRAVRRAVRPPRLPPDPPAALPSLVPRVTPASSGGHRVTKQVRERGRRSASSFPPGSSSSASVGPFLFWFVFSPLASCCFEFRGKRDRVAFALLRSTPSAQHRRPLGPPELLRGVRVRPFPGRGASRRAHGSRSGQLPLDARAAATARRR